MDFSLSETPSTYDAFNAPPPTTPPTTKPKPLSIPEQPPPRIAPMLQALLNEYKIAPREIGHILVNPVQYDMEKAVQTIVVHAHRAFNVPLGSMHTFITCVDQMVHFGNVLVHRHRLVMEMLCIVAPQGSPIRQKLLKRLGDFALDIMNTFGPEHFLSMRYMRYASMQL